MILFLNPNVFGVLTFVNTPVDGVVAPIVLPSITAPLTVVPEVNSGSLNATPTDLVFAMIVSFKNGAEAPFKLLQECRVSSVAGLHETVRVSAELWNRNVAKDRDAGASGDWHGRR